MSALPPTPDVNQRGRLARARLGRAPDAGRGAKMAGGRIVAQRAAPPDLASE
jgi:hypothetical protein